MKKLTPEPQRILPEATWEHYTFYTRIREALYALPLYFRTETYIAGIMATDIFNLNTTFGAAIEEQVVDTLNGMRSLWDPQDKYRLYGFVRQAQTFPDVLFKRLGSQDGDSDIIIGIELKSWYLLAKEKEPSFRFQVTPSACALQDLIVVIPWALSNVISGSPRVFPPFIESARYAAEYRNYHWQYIRNAEGETGIVSPQDVGPYPQKSDRIVDRPVADTGRNFGRFARTGIMDAYLEVTKAHQLCGIEAKYWLSFFEIFHEQRTRQAVEQELTNLRRRVMEQGGTVDETVIDQIRVILSEIEKLIR